MSKVIGYKIVQQNSVDNLLRLVKTNIKKGWIPQGGLSAVIDSSRNTCWHMQSMIKTDNGVEELEVIKEWSELSDEEKQFVLRVRIGGGGKNAAEPHRSEDGEVALWENPEKAGFIESVGSYKFLVTAKFYDLEMRVFGIKEIK